MLTVFYIIEKRLIEFKQFSNLVTLAILIIIFIIIQLFKFARLYAISMEENIKSTDLFKIYIVSLLANICLPYKIGEFYRIYLIGNKNKHYLNSIIIVLIDNFFDAIVLSIMLLTMSLINKVEIQTITILIILFFILFVIIFTTFESTYTYLNTFFIMKKEDKRSVYALKMLEKINDIYLSSKKMIKSRFPLLFLLTFASWGFEIIFMKLSTKFYGIKMSLQDISNYLNDAFFGWKNNILSIYISVGIISIVGTLIIIYIKKLGEKIKCKK